MDSKRGEEHGILFLVSAFVSQQLEMKKNVVVVENSFLKKCLFLNLVYVVDNYYYDMDEIVVVVVLHFVDVVILEN